MKSSLVVAALCSGTFLFVVGCSAGMYSVNQASDQSSGHNSASHFVSSNRSNSYFYYTEAQFEWRKGNLDKATDCLEKAIHIDPESIYLKKDMALLCLQQRNDDKALSIATSILKKKPDDIEALIISGRIFQSRKRYAEACKAYEKVIVFDPSQQNVYLMLGELYMETRKLPDALRVYTRLTDRFPESYPGYFYQGKIYLEQGRLDLAASAFKKTLEIEPNLEEPWFELAELYHREHKPELQAKMYQEFLKKVPDDLHAQMGLGVCYSQQGQPAKAQAIFGDLGKRSVTDQNVIRKLLEYYVEPKRFQDAAAILQGMLPAAPDNSDLHYLAGIVYEGLQDREKALEQFKLIAPSARYYDSAVAQVSFWYQEEGKFQEAVTYIQNAIQQAPDNPELRLYLGTFYEESGDLGEALDAIKAGLKLDPENDPLYFRLGVIYDKMGRKADCINAMKTVLKLDPENAGALNYIGYTYAEMGEHLDEAEQLILKALRIKPDDGYITDSLGWVYFRKGLYRKAVDYLEKAERLTQGDPTVLEHIGDTYLKLDKPQKALDYYRRALLKMEKNPKEKGPIELQAKIHDLESKGL